VNTPCERCKNKEDEIAKLLARLRDADALAYECVKAVMSGDLPAGSTIDNAAVRFLDLNSEDGPATVREWMACYEKAMIEARKDGE
jgi:hypothetical protein